MINRKNIISIIVGSLMAIIVFAAFQMNVQACDKCKKSYAKHCDWSKKDCGKNVCCKKDGLCPMKKKFFKKASFILGQYGELELSEEQTGKIKELKINVKKDLIMKEAEIEVLAIDVKSAMRKSSIDVDAVNTLIDKKYALLADKTKFLVKSFASLKNILNDDQKNKLKKLCSLKKEASCHLADEGK